MAPICDPADHTFEFFSFLKADIWRGLRCHIIFFVSVHSLPCGFVIVAKNFVWHPRLLEIFELDNDSQGSFMRFQAMTFKKLQICRKSLSTFLKGLATGCSKSINWTFGVLLCWRNTVSKLQFSHISVF